MGEEIEIFKIFKDTRIYRNDGKLWKGALWEISNYGNVRKNGDEYIPHSDRDGYFYVRCKKHQFRVHRAVAELFLPNPNNKPTVDHINRNKTDNRACNLRWATHKEQAENRDNDAINAARKGIKLSEEHRAKISAAHKGIKKSEETRAKMSAAHKGKQFSEETRAKLSVAMIGNKNGLGNKNALGHSPSEEARTKMSKYVSNSVWLIHPITNDRKRIPKEQVPDYLSQGYVRGRK